MKEKAWFVFRPRRAEDLTVRNPEGKWMVYRIVKTICMSRIDYENFTTDMLADRQFIEDNAALCARGAVWRCIQLYAVHRVQHGLILPDAVGVVWERVQFGQRDSDDLLCVLYLRTLRRFSWHYDSS